MIKILIRAQANGCVIATLVTLHVISLRQRRRTVQSAVPQILVKYRPNTGQILVKYESYLSNRDRLPMAAPPHESRSAFTGQILVKYWPNTGQILVKYW